MYLEKCSNFTDMIKLFEWCVTTVWSIYNTNLFNFASDLFSQYLGGKYFPENLSPQKFNTSIKAPGNETSQ